MGRSVPTYRMTLDGVFAGWNGFRRALRKEDQEVFDAIVTRARLHASAGSYQAATDPVETVFLAILIEQEKEIRRLRKLWKDGSSTSTPTTKRT